MDLAISISRIRPDALWTAEGSYESLNWLDPVLVKPTLQELESSWAEYLVELPAIQAAQAATATAASQQAAALQSIRVALSNQITVLRQWSTEGTAAVGNWDNWNQTQKNTAMKTFLNRTSIVFDKLADLIVTR